MSEDDVNENPEDVETSADDDWAAAMQEQEVADSQETEKSDDDSLGFEEFDNDPHAGTAISPELDLILDIPVTISMEVGSTSITIKNLLQLNQGSVIELDRLAGEPLNVLVNGTLIAHGEVVVVNEKFGIRMTDVISPAERIKKLG
ncbi:flagellar motor switch protein FliN [Eionea flava]